MNDAQPIAIIEAHNNISQILEPSKLPYDVSQAVFQELSYMPSSAFWANSYRSGKWKGKLYLFNYKTQVFPSGCMSRVCKILKENGYRVKISDSRSVPSSSATWNLVKHRWDRPEKPLELRWFQSEAIERAKKATRGIFSLPTGSGKTTTFTALVAELKVSPTLIFVPTVDLLYQTKDEMEAMLEDNNQKIEIGIIGDSKVNIKTITICIINSALHAYDMYFDHTKKRVFKLDDKDAHISIEEKKEMTQLQAFKPQIKELIETAKCLICDETHRAASDMWKSILWKCSGAYYRFGFSATPFREDGKEMEIEASFGKILMNIPVKQMIDEKILMDPDIYMVDVDYDPDGAELIRQEVFVNPETKKKEKRDISQWVPIEDWTYNDIYKNIVVENSELNNKISGFATEFNSQGLSVLILVKEYAHGDTLEELIPGSIFLKGKDSSKKRKETIQQIKEKKLLTLIATSIADMGLDLPTLDCLILAGGGGSDPSRNKGYEKKNITISKAAAAWISVPEVEDEISTAMGLEYSPDDPTEEARFGGVIEQRIGRVLRKAEGKTEAIVIDFWFKNKKMQNQSKARLKVYKTRGFKVKRIK